MLLACITFSLSHWSTVSNRGMVCQTGAPEGMTDLGALPLSQGDLLKLLGKAQLICQFEQVSHGVRPRGQNKDERRGVAGVQEGACQIERGRLCEA